MSRILLYTHGPRALASSLIGHIHEFTQQNEVVVFTDPLPAEYRELLERRDLFPGLLAIEEFSALGFTFGDLLRLNRDWYRRAVDGIRRHKPDVIVCENDMSCLFDMYLMRAARETGIPRLSIQGMAQLPQVENQALIRRWRLGETRGWRHAAQRLRGAIRDSLGTMLVFELLPLLATGRTLHGPSNYITMTGAPGMRDSQLHLVQTDQQAQACVACGVSPERLAVLPHPAYRVPLQAFLPSGLPPKRERPRALLLLGAGGIGISRNTGAPIDANTMRNSRRAVLDAVVEALTDWDVVLKPHPILRNRAGVEKVTGSLPPKVRVLEPAQSLEPWLADCDLVLDLPAPFSSALVTAAALRPDRPIIAADINHDVGGDMYRDDPSIEYVEDIDALRQRLNVLAAGKQMPHHAPAFSTAVRRFATANEAVAFILDLDDTLLRSGVTHG